MLEPPREDHMPIKPATSRGYLRERHPYLEGNSSFFRQNPDRTDIPDGRNYLVEQRLNLGAFPVEMMREVVPAARV